MAHWSDWTPGGRTSAQPYVDWWLKTQGASVADGTFEFQLTPPSIAGFGTLDAGVAQFSASGGTTPPEGAYGGMLPDDLFPVPTQAINREFAHYWANRDMDARDSWLPRDLDLPTLRKGDVVVGVIDIDVGLGHRRFRTKTGESRVLASWQQGAKFGGQGSHYLPFGEVLQQADINTRLAKHHAGAPVFGLDQDSFNRDCGLVDYLNLEKIGNLAARNAHGTHVMGLAGGADPVADAAFSENVKLLVVNLPQPLAFGEGGTFLDNYLIYGLRWLIEMYALMAQPLEDADLPPLAVNISFGKQAGSKDERQDFVSELDALSDNTDIAPFIRRAPVNVIMPAGNDNNSQQHAAFDLAPIGDEVLEWRIQPEDQTSNFVEIWVTGPQVDAGAPIPCQIDICPPGGGDADFATAYDGHSKSLEQGLGRIYADAVVSPKDGSVRHRYLVALAPSGVPAGQWCIRMRNLGHAPIFVRAMVQTDMVTPPHKTQAKRSYFEDADYRATENSGRAADTYIYDPQAAGGVAPQSMDVAHRVRRHGTMNAYTASDNVCVIAGFRATDGRPAMYSATGFDAQVLDKRMGRPTVALPSEDGSAHFGLLSDGASDGSVVAMRGTSFSCAAATRLAVETWLANGPGQSASDIFAAAGAAAHAAPPPAWGGAIVPEQKAGLGRVPYQAAGRVSRL